MPGHRPIGDVSVAVVIVNYRTPALTEACLAAIRGERETLPKLRVVVVDGGSADSSAAHLAEIVAQPDYSAWVSFLPLDLNGGFGWANNQAILALARDPQPPEFIHLLNPDTEVSAGAVGYLVQDLMQHPRCGAAGSQLLTQEGKPAASTFRFPSVGRELIGAAQSESLGQLLGVRSTVIQAGERGDIDWVTGASVMFRADALRETGLFDDGFFLYFEEVELMHRLKKRGWSVRHVPDSKVMHIEGASTGAGASVGPRPMPNYWYRSRRRYFALTGGYAVLLGANLCFLVGRMIALTKHLAGKPRTTTLATAAGVMRCGFLPRRLDAVTSYPTWEDDPGKPPMWASER